ncbi:MAG TPA: pectate lyase [Pyrinomonadaceae bacterium]|nr:pectate lyase [Pyrinomonadaceae bacterium]
MSRIAVLILTVVLGGGAPAFIRVCAAQAASTTIKWHDALRQKHEWYGGDEAARIADNLIVYQRDSGGWPKNIDMAAALTGQQLAAIAKEKLANDSTIDNGATWTQLNYLARVYTARRLERHKESFLKGVDFLLKAQYDNGGWPQYFPIKKGYYQHITFNDDAMIGVMRLFQDIARKDSAYAFVDQGRRVRVTAAVAKGIECILKTQVIVRGKRTVWCAQHDESTLAPAAARNFEPVSLSGLESVGIVQFLMDIEHPAPRVVDAVESAVAWFKSAQLNGIRWIETNAQGTQGYDHVVVADRNAPPLWARFYEIETNRPIFSGRDRVIRYKVSEIEDERRNGYRWYTDEPAKLLNRDYPAWLKKGVARASRP